VIKTLAEAGVPLARVKDLLAADPGRFAAAISEIDRALAERAEELVRSRERIAQLRELGVSQRSVQMERDGWILLQSASPRQAAVWIADKIDAMRDPEFRAIYLEYDAAFDWSPDDPRIHALAERTERWMAGRYGGPGTRPPVRDPAVAVARLVQTSVGVSSPAWGRLTEIGRKPHARSGSPGVSGGSAGPPLEVTAVPDRRTLGHICTLLLP
jgi:DNA-binding transcriptional MerR regulator